MIFGVVIYAQSKCSGSQITHQRSINHSDRSSGNLDLGDEILLPWEPPPSEENKMKSVQATLLVGKKEQFHMGIPVHLGGSSRLSVKRA